MNRKWLVGLTLVLTAFHSAAAVDKKGKFGLGFFNDDAPLGGRYWITEQIGVDLGIGFNSRNVVDSTKKANLNPLLAQNPTKKSLTEIRLDWGVPFNAIRTEKVNLVLRPGFEYQRRPFFDPVTHDSIEKQGPFIIEVDTSTDPDTYIFGDTLRFNRGVVTDSALEERATALDINFSMGIEYYPAENFSVSLFTGVGARREKRFDDDQGIWTVTHRPFFRGTNIGFHFYF